jgi:GDPmannose 4,6-dehydratase
VREFIEMAFSEVGRTIEWKGRGVDEVGIDAGSGDTLVKIDSRYFRPTEVDLLLGDPSKAERVLGWKATVSFPELVSDMLTSDLKAVAQESRVRGIGND